MPYSTSWLSLRWLYTLQNAPNEVAETGLHVSPQTSNQAAVIALVDAFPAAASDLYTAMQTLLATSGLEWATYSRLSGVRAAGVGTDGKEFTDPVEASFGPNSGSAGQVNPQLSVCISLRSGSRLGRANYGRMFLPHTRMPLVANSPLSATPNALATAGALFIATVNEWADSVVPGALVANMSTVGLGSIKPVTEVQVGSITDTQRRRRDQLQESYGVAVLA